MQLNTFFASSLAMVVTIVVVKAPSITVFHGDQCQDLPGTPVYCVNTTQYQYNSEHAPCVPFNGSMGGPVVLASLKQ